MRLILTLLPLVALAQNGVVLTESGPVRPAVSGATYSYRNIPFAAPPLGALRWRPPQPPVAWSGVRDGSRWGAMCPQYSGIRIVGEEDCLQLNVWVPNPAPRTPAPVLFWIHGGGHVQGSATLVQGGTRIYDGQRLAETTKSVVVTTNYRLGPLGFLALPELSGQEGSSGNLGTLDQVAALTWVRRNIGAFGGDPGRVMIFGESAGAVAVCALSTSPNAAGLFHAGAMHSGACTARTLEAAEKAGRELAEAAGCAADTADCLRAKSPLQLLRARPTDFNISTDSSAYGSVIDGVVQPKAPLSVIAAHQHNAVPIIVGANSDETSRSVPPIETAEQYESLVRVEFGPAAPLVLRQYPVSAYGSPRAAFIAVSTDSRFVCTSRRAARAFAGGQQAPVFRYFFSHSPENGSPEIKAYGAWHGLDVVYMFGTMGAVPGYTPGPADASVAAAFMSYWSQLAAAGDPNKPDMPHWPRYENRDPYLEIASPLRAAEGIRTAQCDFWDRLIGAVQ